jgi:hypothetical protein
MSGTISPPPSSIFADPLTMSMLGMAQGFGQAALPSRMPVPFGAAMGMGAAGMMQGAQQAQQGQLQQQQIQSAQLANQLSRIRMPAYAAMAGDMGFGGGMPMGVPQTPQQPGLLTRVGSWLGLNGQTPAPAAAAPPAQPAPAAGQPPGAAPAVMASPPGAAPAGSGAAPGYVMSPAALYRRGDLAMLTGQDRAAGALYGNAQTEAGGTGYAAGTDGRSFAAPGGPNDPAVQATLAYSKAAGEGAGSLPSYGAKPAIDTTQAGPRAAAVAGANAPFAEPITIPQLQSDGTYHMVSIPRPVWAAQNGGGGGGSSGGGAAGGGGAASGTIPAPVWAQRVQAVENATGNPAATNPNSSAVGNAQFLNGTFVPLFRSTFPQQASSMTDAQVLALRSNPDVANVMTLAYARQNSGVLQQAGVPVNGTTLGLAHRFGPQGAIALLKADPTAPIGSVLGPAVIQANPELAKQPVNNVLVSSRLRYGDAPVDGIGPGAGGAGGPIVGPQTGMTPEQQAVSEGYGKQAAAIEESGAKAPQTLMLLDTLESAASQFRTGATAELRLAGGKALVDGLQAVGITPPDNLLTGVAGGEAINKAGGFLASTMTRQLGSREAAAVFNQVKSFNPNIEQTPQGFLTITNSIRQGVQRDTDLRDFQRDWLNDPTHRGSIAGMQQAFEQAHPIDAYASRVIPLPATRSTTLEPNVIYRNSDGNVRLWDGQSFQPIPGAQ